MKQYYYLGTDGQQQGPVPGDDLKIYGVTRETLVWCEGMEKWAKAGEIPELSHMFATSTPPAPPAPPVQPAPQVQPAPPANEKCPDNYLAWSIITTILCCWPFGIPAIVNATKVDTLWSQGDKEGARQKSKNAKTWCWVAFGCALGVWIIYFILVFCGVFAGTLIEMGDNYYY